MRVHVENASVHGAWNFRLVGRELIYGGFARTKAIMSVPGLNADFGRARCHVAKVPNAGFDQMAVRRYSRLAGIDHNFAQTAPAGFSGLRDDADVSWRAVVYSMTSSAIDSSLGGTSRPSAFAVLRLMTSSNRVG